MKKQTKTYKVAGVSFRQEEIAGLLDLNEDYKLTKKKIVEEGLDDTPIYKYRSKTYPAKLQPEPENKYDRNAVAVMVMGTLVGYIKKEQALHVKHLLEDGRIDSVSAYIKGGPSKTVTEDEDGEYQTTKDDYGLSIELKVEEMTDGEDVEVPNPAPVQYHTPAAEPAKKKPIALYKALRVFCLILAIMSVLLGLLMCIGGEPGIGAPFVVIAVVFWLLARRCKKETL